VSDVRIYVVVASTVFTGAGKPGHVVQPLGRQAAQACHAVSKLRHGMVGHDDPIFQPITTVILQCRDSNELNHVLRLLNRRNMRLVTFSDTNEQAYGGPMPVFTALACLTTRKQVEGILDYLPLF
jgi:hypothetical protein